MFAEILGEISPRMIVATVIGVIGAAIATYWEIANTSGRRERAFMVRACIWFWVGNCIFGAGMWFVSKPYKSVLIPAYIVPVLVGARYCNRRTAAIRAEESNDDA
jgi:hypothetical protein